MLSPENFARFVPVLEWFCRTTGLEIVGAVKDYTTLDYNSQVLYPVQGEKSWMLGPKIIRGCKRFIYASDSKLELVKHVQSLCKAEQFNVAFVPILRDILKKLASKYGVAQEVDKWTRRKMMYKKSAEKLYNLDEDRWVTISVQRYGNVVSSWDDWELIKVVELEDGDIPEVQYGTYSDYYGFTV